jgi:hypothetical protein
LHYVLRDVGCRNGWDVVLPDWEVAAESLHVPFCPSRIADPFSRRFFNSNHIVIRICDSLVQSILMLHEFRSLTFMSAFVATCS